MTKLYLAAAAVACAFAHGEYHAHQGQDFHAQQGAFQDGAAGAQSFHAQQGAFEVGDNHNYQHDEIAPEAPQCLRLCPLDFPMLNPHTMQCSAIPEDAPIPHVQSYGQYGQQGVDAQFRRLMRAMGYGQQAPPAQQFAPEQPAQQFAPEQHAPQQFAPQQQFESDQFAAPAQQYEHGEDLIDTTCGQIWHSGHAIFWVGFAFLFVAAIFFLCLSHYYKGVAYECKEFHEDPRSCNRWTSIFHFLSPVVLVIGIVCLISSLSYLFMATGYGFYVQCSGRMFFYSRFIDWAITTPLLLWILFYLANGCHEFWILIVYLDVIMIVAGLIASTIEGSAAWGFFALSVLAFIPILHYLCKLRYKVLDNREYWADCGMLVHEDDYGKEGTCYLPHIFYFPTLKRLVVLTTIVWFLYPIIWIASEGTWRLCVNGEQIAFTILDIFSKVVFGLILVHYDPCSKDECKEKCKGCLLMDFYDH